MLNCYRHTAPEHMVRLQPITSSHNYCFLHETLFEVIFQKRVRVFRLGFKHEKTDESTRPAASCFYGFQVFKTPMKHEARVFEITSPTKENQFKLSFEYVFSIQLLYLRREICMNFKKMCMMCKVLSPNCCAVTVF